MMKEDILNYKIKPLHSGIEEVTLHGEVCYDYSTKEFVVYEETYAFEVGRTFYPLCAYYMLVAYADNYLEG